MPAVGLTDHGRAGGLLQFKKACEKHDIKPLYGVEVYVAPKSRLLKERVEGYNTSYHLTILAKNTEGLKNVFRLASIGWIEGFYYKPRVDLDTIESHAEGLVVLSGCGAGFLPHMLMEGRQDEVKAYALRMRKIFADDFYIEIQNHGLEWQQPLKQALVDFSNLIDIPPVATQDSHFIKLEEAELHKKVCKLAAGDLEFETDENYFKSYDEFVQRFEPSEHHAIERTNEVAGKCNVDWQFGQTIWPVFELPEGKTADEVLQQKAEEGFKERFGEEGKLLGEGLRSTYRERLAYELGTIRRTGFATYFLVVADFIQWARQNDVPVGPGRGSGAGSLVCYCAGITQIDPIAHGLFFERFINPARISLPDLDIDFCPRGRKDVMAYVAGKYGADRVAQIGTYAAFKPRGSLRDFARAYGHPPHVGHKLAGLVPPDVAGRPLCFEEVLRAQPSLLRTEYPEVVERAREAEGLKTKAGVHAAGVVISDRPLMEQVPLFRGKHDEIATQFDMHDVEELGLVKLDFLGLINLSIIADTVKLVKEIHDVDIDIEKIPEDDQEVFENVFQRGDLDGVFQFETSSGFRDLCVRVQPQSIADLSTITSLFRPGPLGSNLVNRYVDGRNGGEVEYLTPELEPILGETCGVRTFQEQVIRACMDLAGHSASEADNMRKIIGKKEVAKMPAELEKFSSGCAKNNISKKAARAIVKQIEDFSKYAFNRAHATAYSVISYRTAWLKHYYPEEFYCALFNNTMKEQDQLVKYIYSCKERGIPLEPPDVNRSQALFSIDKGTIIFGLAGIKGVGAKACAHLLESRPERGFQSLKDLVDHKVDSGTLKSLAASGSLQDVSTLPAEQLLCHLPELLEYYKKLNRWQERGKRIAQREKEIQEAVAAGHKPPRRLPRLPEAPTLPEVLSSTGMPTSGENTTPSPAGTDPPTTSTPTGTSRGERLRMEKETLGFYLTGHPLDEYPRLQKMAPYNIEKVLESGVPGSTVRLAVAISRLTKKRTRKGANMALLILEDRTGRIEATVFPRTWKKIRDEVEENDVALVTCKVNRETAADGDTAVTRLIVNDVQRIKDKEVFTTPQISDIVMKLRDGSEVVFSPPTDTEYEAWQRAMAIARNLETTG
jgi:DNA polymerase-3 subunit alpha